MLNRVVTSRLRRLVSIRAPGVPARLTGEVKQRQQSDGLDYVDVRSLTGKAVRDHRLPRPVRVTDRSFVRTAREVGM